MELLEAFKKIFSEKARKLIAMAEVNQIVLPEPMRLNFQSSTVATGNIDGAVASHDGVKPHEAGLLVAERFIGPDQVVNIRTALSRLDLDLPYST